MGAPDWVCGIRPADTSLLVESIIVVDGVCARGRVLARERLVWPATACDRCVGGCSNVDA